MREALARSDRDFLLSDKVEETPSRYVGMMRVILQRPAEVAGLAVMGGLGLAILVNALVLQNGTHTSPFIAQRGSVSSAPSVPGASERGSADATAPDAVAVLRDVQLALAERGLYDGLADGVLGPKTTTAIRSFQQHNGMPVDGQPSAALLTKIVTSSGPLLTTDPSAAEAPAAPPVDQIAALINGEPTAPVGPQPDKRVLGVEKALAKQGYGPLKVDGFMAADTRNAISRFEKDRGLPVTGQISARLLQELARSGTKVE
ncbi:peptidoglycan-binding protein [Labrys sp. KNU-23]|uniref:peptidoglycan-binding domain-containing protein n=1 Tax=Labrys sp. KNU-23 TaxID=2789216 RepID=UPI0011EEE591|nr:peptidoglycan-binding protein [Labrys sp. KNU-23]QEN90157.1 peptidoglycan-binding protein [Labrys sp. KNU-23]